MEGIRNDYPLPASSFWQAWIGKGYGDSET